jgi:hypothetical protein
MKDDTRMVTTAVIWTAFTIIMGIIAAVLAITGAELDEVGIIALLVVIIGLMVTVANSTMAIWGFKSDEKAESEEAHRAKSKRTGQNRIARLIEELDDEEIYDLEALLLARDEDAPQKKLRS